MPRSLSEHTYYTHLHFKKQYSERDLHFTSFSLRLPKFSKRPLLFQFPQGLASSQIRSRVKTSEVWASLVLITEKVVSLDLYLSASVSSASCSLSHRLFIERSQSAFLNLTRICLCDTIYTRASIAHPDPKDFDFDRSKTLGTELNPAENPSGLSTQQQLNL